MIKRFIFLFIFWGSALAWAQNAAIEPALRDLCNQAMLYVYQDILAVKDRYPELADFNEKSFYENRDGIYAIFYEKKTSSLGGKPSPYAFGLTIENIKAQTFYGREGVSSFAFSALGIKFSSFQLPPPKRSQFNLRPLINRHGILISLEEQRHLPLRLELKPTKATFELNEPIEFDVVLTNVGKSNIFVKKLNFDMLYFVINNKPWGKPLTQKVSGGERVTLRQGESIRTRFKGQSYATTGVVEIHAVYRLLVNGVNPFATLKVQIVP